MSKESILFLCQFFYPETVSSATLPFDTAKAYAQAEYTVGCMCGYPHEYLTDHTAVPTEETVDGIHIKRIKYRSFSRVGVLGRIVNYFSFTWKCWRNIRHIREYDRVIVYSNPPILPYVAYRAHKKYGTKITFVCYDVYPEIAIASHSTSPDGMIAKCMRYINRKLYPCLDRLVVLSDDMKEFLETHRDISPDRITVIPNWYEERAFVPPDKREPFTVTYMGNMGTCQDMDTLLHAALLLKDDASVRFRIGGHGNKAEAAKTFIAQNALKQVEILPFLTGEEYDAHMTQSHCFVVSLERNLKGLCFPSKYYSYLAYGRPILAVSEPNGLTQELEAEQIGETVENADAAALVAAIKQYQNMDEATYDDVCRKAHTVFAKHYTTNISTTKYIHL